MLNKIMYIIIPFNKLQRLPMLLELSLSVRNLLTQTAGILVKTPVNLSFKVVGTGTTESDKPPIFLLHGLLGSKRHWKGTGKTIMNMTKRTVVVVDARNHGDSPHINSNKYDEMATDLISLLDKLEVNKASIVGHDIGGMIGMCTSLMAPDRVAGLVVVDISPVSTAVHMRDMLKILEAVKAVDFKNSKKVPLAKKEAKRQLKQLVNDDVLMCRILSNIKAKPDGSIGWACNIDCFVKKFRHFLSFPKSLQGKQYKGPCLFIGGQMSEYLPADDLTNIRDIFPNAVVRYIPKVGHNLHLQDARSFLELAIDFLRTNQ